MAKRKTDPAREHRIDMEILVDAYTEEERAMGWYVYLEDKLHFPFRARCVAKKRISPLKVGAEVEVTGLAPEDEAGPQMLVLIHWEDHTLGVPLAQLEGIATDAATRQAIEDWHYWVEMGHQF